MGETPDNIVPITPDARSAAENFSSDHNRELLTILFTDLVDSTKLQSDLGNVEAARITEVHREIVRDELGKYDAREIEWAGDSCLAVFTKPSDGIVFALKLQAAMRNARLVEGKLPTVRIGLHLGEIVVRHRGEGAKHTEDLFGLQVSEAARVMSLARGDQIYCTRPVFDNARSSLKGQTFDGLATIVWKNYGLFELKGSEDPAEVCEVGEEGLAPLTPPVANDKCRPIRGDLEKWRKRRARGQHPRRGIPAWSLVAVAVAAVVIGLLIGRGTATTPSTVSSEALITSLAVLPLDNLMNDPAQDYFVDGMTEAITAELSKISSLKVISRTSTMRYKETDLSMPEIAAELGVHGLIEGSVMREGDDVRITVQLIDGPDDRHLWAESYTNTVTSVLKLQAEVALAIAAEIRAKVEPDEKRRIADKSDIDPDALEAYLRGRQVMQSRAEDDMLQAIEEFQRAIEIDDTYAAAYSGMADAYNLLGTYEFLPAGDAFTKAEDAARKAISLDPNLADAYASLGWPLMRRKGDWKGAGLAFERSLSLDPNFAQGHLWYGSYLALMGRNREAREASDRSVELDPNSLINRRVAAFHSMLEGDFERANRELEELLEQAPDFLPALGDYADTLLLVDRKQEALVVVEKYAALRNNDAVSTDRRAGVLVRLGRLDEAKSLVEHHSDADTFQWTVYYISTGDIDRALAGLGKRMLVGEIRPELAVAPIFAPLRDDDRYWEFLEEQNYPHMPPGHPVYEQQEAYRIKKAARDLLAEQPKPVRRFDIPIQNTFDHFQTYKPFKLSRDGTKLVYVGRGESGERVLFLHDFEQGTNTELPDTQNPYQPFFSPDGESVAFFDTNRLMKVSVHGGGRINLAPIFNSRGGTWGTDGTIVYAPNSGSSLQRIPAEGGISTELTKQSIQFNGHRWPRFLPDGKTVLFTSNARHDGRNTGAIFTVSLETGEVKKILDRGFDAHYVSSGHLVYAISDALMAVPFDLDRLETVGAPRPVVNDLRTDNDMLFAYYDVSDDGLLTYLSGETGGSLRQPLWIDLEGREKALDLQAGLFEFPAISPNGSHVAFTKGGNIHVFDLSRASLSRFTFEQTSNNIGSLWSPDGTEIFFASDRDAESGGTYTIFRKSSDGSGQEVKISNEMGSILPTSVSSDGETLIVYDTDSTTGFNISELPLSGNGESKSLLQTRFNEGRMKLSPDGNWMAYSSDESGHFEVYVRRYPEMSGKWQVSIDGGGYPLWAPDMSKMYYRGQGSVMAVDLDVSESFHAGQPYALFEDRYVNHPGYSYDLSPDGKRFLMLKQVDYLANSDGEPLKAVTNWFEELKRLVPIPESN